MASGVAPHQRQSVLMPSNRTATTAARFSALTAVAMPGD